ncbi:hypothetical protein VNO78_02865 [Psophocarpus tetragonolobus]|uniref:Uncharacterized protein n=1 Tax=Psophocarpus tetragonolobus TaxID=3891 RepID=A0AAN9SZE4_PSOTE
MNLMVLEMDLLWNRFDWQWRCDILEICWLLNEKDLKVTWPSPYLYPTIQTTHSLSPFSISLFLSTSSSSLRHALCALRTPPSFLSTPLS